MENEIDFLKMILRLCDSDMMDEGKILAIECETSTRLKELEREGSIERVD